MSGWVQCNHRGPYKKEAGGGVVIEEEVRERERFGDATLLDLKMETGATSPGKQAASRSRKRPGNGFSH